eukprot:3093964-Prymnesium_polylepis.1
MYALSTPDLLQSLWVSSVSGRVHRFPHGFGWDWPGPAGTGWDGLGPAETGWDRLGRAGTGWDRLGPAGLRWKRGTRRAGTRTGWEPGTGRDRPDACVLTGYEDAAHEHGTREGGVKGLGTKNTPVNTYLVPARHRRARVVLVMRQHIM